MKVDVQMQGLVRHVPTFAVTQFTDCEIRKACAADIGTFAKDAALAA
jgi:hypothetical protein